MTVTENGRVPVDEETLALARQKFVDGTPSKRDLQKHLRKGWDVVNQVYTILGAEVEEAAVERRRAARAAMRRLATRKRSGSVRPIRPGRFWGVNEINPETAPAPVVEPVAVRAPEAVREHPASTPATASRRRVASWPIWLLLFPAGVAIWGGWVDMGRLTGFGVVHPFPGIPGLDHVAVNLAICLPVSLETYAAYALYVWLSALVPVAARRFAKRSAMGSLVLGALGQIAYHLMAAAHVAKAPWWITTVVACLPVAVLGMGAALRHLVHAQESSDGR